MKSPMCIRTLLEDIFVALDGSQLMAKPLQQHIIPQIQSAIKDSTQQTTGIVIIAIGKAAIAMAEGVALALNEANFTADISINTLIIAKKGQQTDFAQRKQRQQKQGLFFNQNTTIVFSAHPLLDQSSLQAGQQLNTFIQHQQSHYQNCHFIVCISGGASAMVEQLHPHWQLEQVQQLNQWLLDNPIAIDTINAIRCCYSALKGGGLLRQLKDNPNHSNHLSKVYGLFFSDVPDDNPKVIGSGLLSEPNQPNQTHQLTQPTQPHQSSSISNILKNPPLDNLPAEFANWLNTEFPPISPSISPPTSLSTPPPNPSIDYQQIVFNNTQARQVVKQLLEKHNIEVDTPSQTWYRLDSLAIQQRFQQWHQKNTQQGSQKALLAGGEMTLSLPKLPKLSKCSSVGGRNSHLCLTMATLLEQYGGAFIAFSTDGDDGPHGFSGCWLTQEQLPHIQAIAPIQSFIDTANTAEPLQHIKQILPCQHTGNNVNDIWLYIPSGIWN